MGTQTSLLVIFLFHVFVLSMAPAQALATLEASLILESTVGSRVIYKLTNTGDEVGYYVPWNTPLDAIQGSKVNNPFHIKAQNGEVLKFPGIIASRVPPSDEYAVRLEPGNSVHELVDLASSYEFPSTGGTFTVKARNPWDFDEVWTPSIQVQIDEKSIQDAQDIRAAHDILDGHNFELNAAVGCAAKATLNCSASQITQIDQAFADAAQYVQLVPCWDNDEPGDDISNMWFGQGGLNMGTIRQQFHNMADLICQTGNYINGSQISCDCSDSNLYAYVQPDDIEFHTVYVCPRFWLSVALGQRSRMGILVSELSHFLDIASTDDQTTACADTLALVSSNTTNARNNGMNFMYYVERACGSPDPLFCAVEHLDWVGDAVCDDSGYNVEICDYDGGDCCEDTCVVPEECCGDTCEDTCEDTCCLPEECCVDTCWIPEHRTCGDNGFDCVDPNACGTVCCETCSLGVCSNLATDGTNCTDGEAATIDDICSSGVCVGHDPDAIRIGFYSGSFTPIDASSFTECLFECEQLESCVQISYRAASSFDQCRLFSVISEYTPNGWWQSNTVPDIILIGAYDGESTRSNAETLEECIYRCEQLTWCIQISYRHSEISNVPDVCNHFSSVNVFDPLFRNWRSNTMPCEPEPSSLYLGTILERIYDTPSFETCCAECSKISECVTLSYRSNGECRLLTSVTGTQTNGFWVSPKKQWTDFWRILWI